MSVLGIERERIENEKGSLREWKARKDKTLIIKDLSIAKIRLVTRSCELQKLLENESDRIESIP